MVATCDYPAFEVSQVSSAAADETWGNRLFGDGWFVRFPAVEF
jgi:hypothetical protein